MRDETQHRSPQQKLCGYEYTVKRGDSFYLIAQRLGVPLRDLLEANSEVNPARLMVGDVLCVPMEEDDAVTTPAQEPAPAPVEEPEPIIEAPPATVTLPMQPEAAAAPRTAEAPATVAELVLDAMPPEPQAAAQDDVGIAIESTAAAELTVQLEAAACESNAEVSYTVADGDTAAVIQQAADISLKTLQAANPDVDLDHLQAGDALMVPVENKPCTTARFYRMEEGGNLEALALLLDVSVAALLRANPCLAPSDFKAGAVVSLP